MTEEQHKQATKEIKAPTERSKAIVHLSDDDLRDFLGIDPKSIDDRQFLMIVDLMQKSILRTFSDELWSAYDESKQIL